MIGIRLREKYLSADSKRPFTVIGFVEVSLLRYTKDMYLVAKENAATMNALVGAAGASDLQFRNTSGGIGDRMIFFNIKSIFNGVFFFQCRVEIASSCR